MKQAKKDLQKISKQLKGSAKMYASQAKKLECDFVHVGSLLHWLLVDN